MAVVHILGTDRTPATRTYCTDCIVRTVAARTARLARTVEVESHKDFAVAVGRENRSEAAVDRNLAVAVVQTQFGLAVAAAAAVAFVVAAQRAVGRQVVSATASHLPVQVGRQDIALEDHAWCDYLRDSHPE